MPLDNRLGLFNPSAIIKSWDNQNLTSVSSRYLLLLHCARHHRHFFKSLLQVLEFHSVIMECRLFQLSFWIIIVMSEALICLGVPVHPDPFQGMDDSDDGRFEMELLQKIGVKNPFAAPSIDKKDLVIPDHIYAKYSSLLKHHRVRRKAITQGVHENPGKNIFLWLIYQKTTLSLSVHGFEIMS